MKTNTTQIKQVLEQALKSVPHDTDLQGVRSHLVAAINQVNAVEYRRQRKETTQRQLQVIEDRNAEAKAAGVMPWQLTLPQARLAIKNLDQMIDAELNKIAEMHNAKQKSGPSNLFTD